ncbi:iron chelate uptake ABC transporter family permease subunit [Streptomyces sp. NPDC059639]|uniref:iron chelate uptake ABC transporter family permease subunit n=1 Tax=Streptomyces sp. NPDC059639 TaxID=3346891 RepID=UPI0036CE6FEE
MALGEDTAAAGPIAFVGLAVPHLTRALVGVDMRRQLLCGALIGPVLLLLADVVGRVVVRPQELMVGVVTAFAGAVLATAVVHVSTGTGFRNPTRLVVAGVAVTAMATAFIQYIVYAIERDQATVLSSYLNGSLTARSWSDAGTAGAALLVCVPLAAALSRPLTASEMGQDTAASPVFEKLPVGVWTMALGGLYLGHLLFREWRKGLL